MKYAKNRLINVKKYLFRYSANKISHFENSRNVRSELNYDKKNFLQKNSIRVMIKILETTLLGIFIILSNSNNISYANQLSQKNEVQKSQNQTNKEIIKNSNKTNDLV